MKKMITLILVVAIVAAGLLLLKKRKSDLAQALPAPPLPAVVATADLKIQPVILTLPAMGIVASDISAVLSTRISGQVTEVFKQEGDPVKKGEILARIDATDLEAKKQGVTLQRQGIVFQVEAKKAEVNALEMSLKSAQEAHARTKELLDIKGASEEQYSQEEAEIAKLKAGLSAARNSIETLQKSMGTLGASMREIDSLKNYATLVAPIDGTVSQILARPGDLATPGKPMLRISSKAGLYLNLSLPDALRTDEVMLAGQSLPLTSKDQTGETGLVQYVAPLPQNIGLVEGQFVNVNVVVYKGEEVLLPIDALLTMDGSSSVFVLAPDGKAQRLAVTIKARGVEGATVVQDLAGRKVIVAKPDILLRVATGVPVVERNS
ncbi:MAG: efflux RND transporter periplasmic adaptor subunit [Deltaproteobacteria bacterium]|nr:efflux RND transporter periplasmic adaptor subunit [Deltaproteobacteria bacterium]